MNEYSSEKWTASKCNLSDEWIKMRAPYQLCKSSVNHLVIISSVYVSYSRQVGCRKKLLLYTNDNNFNYFILLPHHHSCSQFSNNTSCLFSCNILISCHFILELKKRQLMQSIFFHSVRNTAIILLSLNPECH